MADLKLKIVAAQINDIDSLCIVDASTYPDNPPVVVDPFLTVTPPGFPMVSIDFNVNEFNIITTDIIELTPPGVHGPMPDGIYRFKYTIDPPQTNHAELSVFKVDRLQEKFDKVFMSLDMMECDMAIKKQAKVNLNTVYLLIQGAIAAANSCAEIEAYKLYDKASQMLDNMMKKNCGCGSNLN